MEMSEEQELILDLLKQGCGDSHKGKDVIDNMATSTYEDACEYLTKLGILEKINTRLYRIKEAANGDS